MIHRGMEETTVGGGSGPHIAVPIDAGQKAAGSMRAARTHAAAMSPAADGVEIEVSPVALQVAASVERKLTALEGRALEEARPTIWKVPHDVRGGDDDHAYDPKFISIGPYHHGKPELRPMEDVKLLYTQHLLGRDEQNQLRYYADAVLGREREARRQYSDAFDDLSPGALAEIMMLDGCFLVELLLKRAEKKVGRPLTTHVRNLPTLRHELLLLENQIPLFVLQAILDRTAFRFDKWESEQGECTLVDLALHYLCKGKITKAMLPERYWRGGGKEGSAEGTIYHLLHLSYICLDLALEQRVGAKNATTVGSALRDMARIPTAILLFPLVRLRRTVSVVIITFLYVIVSSVEMLFVWNKPGWYASRKKVPDKPRMVPTATELQEAGVLLKKKEEFRCRLDVSFDDGVLEIPPVTIQASTSSEYRNLLAFEQGCPAVGNNFMSYVVLMDNLVNTAHDVAALRRAGVLDSKLGSDEEVALFFNGIRVGTFLTYDRHYLVGLFKALNDYCNVDCNRWRAKLVRDYFGSPWTVLSLLAAIAALVMTGIQTYYTVR